MVAHKVNNTGVYPENVTGVLDVSPDSPIDRDSYNRHEYATEPLLSMWLMYACPYQLNGKLFGCGGRKSMVENTGTTFMANERALSFEHGQSQVGLALYATHPLCKALHCSMSWMCLCMTAISKQPWQ